LTANLTNPIFHDEDAARAHLEAQRWPNGPECPHCGEAKRVHRLEGKSHRKGLFQCNACLQAFSVTVGTVMERSKIPLAKWVLGFHLMASAKKGVSAHQLHRQLGITYKTAWFLAMRIREAMRLPKETRGPIGGKGKTVEADETFVGGKAKNVHRGKPTPKKYPVVALIERDGEIRVQHVADVTAKTLRETLNKQVSKQSHLMTDDSLAYYWIGPEFAAHDSVNHSKGQYVSMDGKAHINTAESFFAILKRGVTGSFHSVSEKHLQRDADEFAFRWNNRVALGVEDAERANRAIKGAAGKRLTYRQADTNTNA